MILVFTIMMMIPTVCDDERGMNGWVAASFKNLFTICNIHFSFSLGLSMRKRNTRTLRWTDTSMIEIPLPIPSAPYFPLPTSPFPPSFLSPARPRPIPHSHTRTPPTRPTRPTLIFSNSFPMLALPNNKTLNSHNFVVNDPMSTMRQRIDSAR